MNLNYFIAMTNQLFRNRPVFLVIYSSCFCCIMQDCSWVISVHAGDSNLNCWDVLYQKSSPLILMRCTPQGDWLHLTLIFTQREMTSQVCCLVYPIWKWHKIYLLLLSQLSEVNHITSVIHLMFCIEIMIMKLEVAGIVNEGILVCKMLHSLRKIPVLSFFK